MENVKLANLYSIIAKYAQPLPHVILAAMDTILLAAALATVARRH